MHDLVPALITPLLIATPVSYTVGLKLLQIHQLNETLRYLLNHDQMSGLLVRQAFFTALNAMRGAREGVIIAIDIDHFKAINDTYGHLDGDSVIVATAQFIRSLAQGQPAARFGGEEFMLFLPDTSLEAGTRFAEALVRGVERLPVRSRDHGDIKVTISAGVCNLPPSADLDTALIHADDALYQAKKSGRNRVCVAPALQPTPLDRRHTRSTHSRFRSQGRLGSSIEEDLPNDATRSTAT
jgi:diguanylate cyclase (GGDEF)-like protein